MGDKRELRYPVLIEDEARCGLELLAGIGGIAQRRIGIRGLIHLRITVGQSEAEKVETPDVKPGRAQGIAPGTSVEAMGNGESGRKRRTMHVKHHPLRGRLRRQMPQEQLQASPGTLDPVVLLAGIELLNIPL